MRPVRRARAGACDPAGVGWPGTWSSRPSSALTPRQLAGLRVATGFEGRAARSAQNGWSPAARSHGVILFSDNVGGPQGGAGADRKAAGDPRRRRWTSRCWRWSTRRAGWSAACRAATEALRRRGRPRAAPAFAESSAAPTGAQPSPGRDQCQPVAPVADVARRAASSTISSAPTPTSRARWKVGSAFRGGDGGRGHRRHRQALPGARGG